MKKKILSIALVLMLLLNTFAPNVYANEDPVTAENQLDASENGVGQNDLTDETKQTDDPKTEESETKEDASETEPKESQDVAEGESESKEGETENSDPNAKDNEGTTEENAEGKNSAEEEKQAEDGLSAEKEGKSNALPREGEGESLLPGSGFRHRGTGEDFLRKLLKDKNTRSILCVDKTWQGQDKGIPVTIRVYDVADLNTPLPAIVFRRENQETFDDTIHSEFTFTKTIELHLPAYRDNGQLREYKVVETPSPEFNTVSISPQIQSVPNERHYKIHVINSANVNNGTTEHTVKKIWKGAIGKEVTFKLYANNEKALDNNGEHIQITLPHNGKWEYTFRNLPKVDKAGRRITYTAKENTLVGFQTPEYKLLGNVTTVTNTLDSAILCIDKEWKVGSESKPDMEVEIEVFDSRDTEFKNPLQAIVYRRENNLTGDNTIYTRFKYKETIELWLPKYDITGNYDPNEVMDYIVREVPNPKYHVLKATRKTESAPNHYKSHLFNTIPVNVNVTKKWVGPEGHQVTIILKANGQEKDRVVLPKNGSWSHTFANLPKYDMNNTQVQYTVEELDLPGYTKDIQPKGHAYDFTITNTAETDKLCIHKEWKVGNGIKPDMEVSVKVYDSRDTKFEFPLEGTIFTKEGKKPSDADKGKRTVFSFKEKIIIELPKYNTRYPGNDPIVYVVKEEKNSQYKELHTTDMTMGNTYKVVTVVNTPVVDIPVTKIWRGASAPSVTIRLFADGNPALNEKGEEIFVVLNGSESPEAWKHTFKGLPRMKKVGSDYHEIKYTVKEDKIDGYTTDIQPSGAGYSFEITNTKNVEVSVAKKWLHEAGTATSEVKAELWVRKGNTERKVADAITVPNDGTAVKFPMVNILEAGEEFFVKEINAPQGYYVDIVKNGETFTIHNIKTTNIRVKKTWRGKEGQSVTIRVKVQGKDEVVRNTKGELMEKTLNGRENPKWEHEFTDLALFDKNGNKIDYVVEEEKVAGYKLVDTIKTNDGKSVEFINASEETIRVKVTKEWIGAEPKAGQNVIIVLRNKADLAKEIDRVSLPKAGATGPERWIHVFMNLPKIDEKSGNEIDYIVEELPIAGYELKDGKVLGDANAGFVLKNYNTEKTKVKVTKEWIGPKANQVVIVLKADNKVKDRVTLPQNGKWDHEFTDLPVYNPDNGAKINYTVEEEPIPGYELKGGKPEFDANKGYVFTNINRAVREISVNKKWVGPEAGEVTIQLVADGKDVQGKTLKLNVNNNWAGKFTNLPKYDETTGNEIQYTIKEVSVPNYSSVITGSMDNGFTVTNTNTEKVEITVNKVWLGKTGSSVVIKLFADGKQVGADVTLNEGNKWTHTFSGLDKYDQKTGKLIKYKVEEVNVPGYNSGMGGNDADGNVNLTTDPQTGKTTGKVTITNTITGKVSVPVTKVWHGKGLDSVEVHLTQNGKRIDKITLSAANSWTHTFGNLDQYDGQGNEYTYGIEEDDIPGYTKKIEGNINNGFTVTNTNTEKTKVKVTKQWIGPKQSEVTVKLLADGVEKATAVLNDANNWTHTFDNLDKYDPTKAVATPINYTIEEVKVQGYDSKIEGNGTDNVVITNSSTEKIKIAITKKWVGPEQDSVTLKLMADGVEKERVTLTKANGWKHTFENLDRYDRTAVGVREIKYTIEEVKINNYDSKITGEGTGDVTVTNTNIEKVNIPVEKKWVGYQKDQAEIHLLQDGTKVAEVILNAANNWKHTFMGWFKYDQTTGKEYNYTVEEVLIPGYTADISKDADGKYTITNTLIPPTPHTPYDPPTTPPSTPPTPTPPTPEPPTPTPPTPTPNIPDEPIPLAPAPTPEPPVIPIEEKIIPKGKPELPKTGGIPAGMMYLAGMALSAFGIFLRKKR